MNVHCCCNCQWCYHLIEFSIDRFHAFDFSTSNAPMMPASDIEKAFQPLDANKWQTGFAILHKFHLYSAFISFFFILEMRKLMRNMMRKKTISRIFFWKWKKTELYFSFVSKSNYLFFFSLSLHSGAIKSRYSCSFISQMWER